MSYDEQDNKTTQALNLVGMVFQIMQAGLVAGEMIVIWVAPNIHSVRLEDKRRLEDDYSTGEAKISGLEGNQGA